MRPTAIPSVLLLILGLAPCGCAGGPALPTPPSPADLAAACDPTDDDCPPVESVHMLPGEQEPVYETQYDPIYETRRTPVWGEKTVGVFRTRNVPVTLTVPDPCTGCDRQVVLWHKEEKVQVGVKRVPACIGYREERVRVGRCPRKVLVGWRTVEAEDPCP